MQESTVTNTKLQILIVSSFALRLLYALFADPEGYEIAYLYDDASGTTQSSTLVYQLINLLPLDNIILQLRFPLLVLFSLSLYMFYKITCILFCEKVAYMALLILHAFPILAYTGSTSSTQSLFILFTLISWFIVKKYPQSPYHSSDLIAGLLFIPAIANDAISVFAIVPLGLVVCLDSSSALSRSKRLFNLIAGFLISVSVHLYFIPSQTLIAIFDESFSFNLPNLTYVGIKILFYASPWMLLLVFICAGFIITTFLSRHHDKARSSIIEILGWTGVFMITLLFKINYDEVVFSCTLIIAICASATIAYSIHSNHKVFSNLLYTLTLACVMGSLCFYIVGWASIRNSTLPTQANLLKQTEVGKVAFYLAKKFVYRNAGYRSFARSIQRDYGNVSFVFSDQKDIAMQLSFYTESKVYFYGEVNSTLSNNGEHLGKDAVFITSSNASPYLKYIRKHFDRVHFLKEVSVTKNEKVFRRFFIYQCGKLKIPFNYELQPQS